MRCSGIRNLVGVLLIVLIGSMCGCQAGEVNAEFTVGYVGKSLAVYDPLEKRNVGLRLPDGEGMWEDEFNKNSIFFDFDENGKVTAMNINSKNTFKKQKE